MAFPNTPLPITVELQLGSTWTDITSDVRAEQQIRITRGRSDWGQDVDPGTCTLTLDNNTGKYSPRNPNSVFYGQTGRNTPIRVSVNSGQTYLQTIGNTDGVSTPDTGVLDITGDIDIRIEAQLNDWSPSGQMELCGKWDFPSAMSWIFYLDNGKPSFVWSADGSTSTFMQINTIPTPPPSGRMAMRVTFSPNNGAGGKTATFYTAPSIAGPWTQIQAPYTLTGTTSIFSGTSALFVGAVSTTAFIDPAGKFYAFQLYNGINGTLVANADFTTQTTGATSFTDSTGRTWTTRGGATLTNRQVRFVGETTSWAPRWETKHDIVTEVQASGVLRRLTQGSKSLDSTLRRRIPSGNPKAYWPMEDGSEATQAASALTGGSPLSVSGLTFASDSSLSGSSPLPVLGSFSTITGAVQGAAAGGWHVEMVYNLAALPATEQTMLSVRLNPDSTGGITQAVLRVSTAGIRVQALDIDGNVVAFFLFTTAAALTAFVGKWNRLQIFSAVSGFTTYVNAAWFDINTNSWWYANTSYSGAPGTVIGVSGSWGSDFQGMVIGHLAVFDVGGVAPPSTAPGVFIYDGADNAFLGETASTRIVRLCGEEGITAYTTGDSTEVMGAQEEAAFVDVLRETANADEGILCEGREYVGFKLRNHISLNNQPPSLAIDYSATPGLVTPLEPTDDDQSVRNDITVTRTNGSSSTLSLDSGALSTQTPPSGVGRYTDSITINIEDDDRTLDHAGWRLHVGTWDETRYPVVHLVLAKMASQLETVSHLDTGDVIQINNPPSWLPPGPINLMVQGYTETIDQFTWNLDLNCTPSGPWNVAYTGIVEDFEDTTYAVSITNGGNLPWFRSQAHFNTGSWSFQSGAISNNQTSDAIIAVPYGATELTFWYRTSSEASGPGFAGDRLIVLVDSTQVLLAQGETGWTSFTTTVTGASSVTFRYAKDNSATSGEDAVWIDDLTFKTQAPMRADTAGSQLASSATSTATSLSVSTTSGPRWIDSAAHPEEFPFDIMVGGERMRVTAVSGTSSPQTFTVIRSRNNIVKSQSSGTAVQLADVAYIAL
jgi:hypothetical protein